MKTGVFVEKLGNVTRFMDATRMLEKRGAREACWLLAEGDAGYGKTRTLMWYAAHHNAIFVRAKADYSPMWLLLDLADALGIQPGRRKRALFQAICAEILTRGCPAVVVDEIDHATHDRRVLETLRDISDACECPVIAGGMKGAEASFKSFTQIHSRVAEIVPFGPASMDDLHTICTELSEVKIAADLAAEVQKRTAGRLRLIMNAVARIEAYGRRGKGEVTLADWGNRPLLNSDRGRPALAIVPVEAARG